MVTKWKGWTARTAVKIISFLLILALCFVILNRINSCVIRTAETRISPEIVFSDINNGGYFFDRYMRDAYFYASQLLYYKSEASILNGEHIEWEEYENGAYLFDTGRHTQYGWFDKPVIPDEPYAASDNNGFGTAHIPKESPQESPEASTDAYTEERKNFEQNAIRQQLNEFLMAWEWINNSEGLLYHITDAAGSVLFGNAEAVPELYRSKLVYFITDEYGRKEISSSENYPSSFYMDTYQTDYPRPVIYLAYATAAVTAKNIEYSAAKNAYVTDIAIVAASAILILVLLIILLAGAGRRYSDSDVHFLVIDKPFLDISLAAALCWIVFSVYMADEFSRTIWYYRNSTAMNIYLASAVLLVVSPALLWLMSLIKRMKAGRFWRYTLMYYLPSRFGLFIKSLWAGAPLTIKVSLISIASFFLLIINGIAGFSYEFFFVFITAIAFTAIVAIFLLRYARRIHILEQEARNASAGGYDKVINVGGGELGSIANSINNISSGINSAVEQRMKSERLKTELITNVSHDIRTPLTSIITYTDLLKHEGLTCAKAPEYLDILTQKSQRLKILTDELFEAAKAASGNIEVNISALDLTSLINQVLGELDGAIKASGLDLRIKLPSHTFVMADGKLLWRVMENLMSNVFKYALPNSRVYLDVELENFAVRIDIKNISATELNVDPSELTERFKRGDESRSDGGSGLGLSIVQSFIIAQGGRFAISIDGDLFKATIHLPAANGVF